MLLFSPIYKLQFYLPCFVLTFLISHKWYSIGEVLNLIFFFGIAKVLAVERDVKLQNLNFTEIERRGGINGEGTCVRINTVCQLPEGN